MRVRCINETAAHTEKLDAEPHPAFQPHIQIIRTMYSCSGRAPYQLITTYRISLFNTYPLHADSPNRKQTALASGQGTLRFSRRHRVGAGHHRHLPARLTDHTFRPAGRSLLCQGLAACASVDAAAPADRPHAAQLGRASQSHVADQVRGDRLDVHHDCRIDLEFFRSPVGTAEFAGTGCDRCGDSVTDTDPAASKQPAEIKNA